jgi:hypothetical protein
MHVHKPIDTALIISLNARSINALTLLGTGGWIPPRDREVLDWITFIKLLGWRTIILHPDDFTDEMLTCLQVKWLILTGNSESISTKALHTIFKAVKSHAILLVVQAGIQGQHLYKYSGFHIGAELTSGNLLEWTGAGKKENWTCLNTIELPCLEFGTDCNIVATLGGKIIVASRKTGRGKIIALSFHSSEARDLEGSFSALLKHLLIFESLVPVAWINWDNTLILRMDDPGSCEAVYHLNYRYEKLNEQEWKFIGEELRKRDGRISLGYVPAWVDDGDDTSGALSVEGSSVPRLKGNIHPSPLVKYKSLENNLIYDFESEFRGIQSLREAGLADIELHGYTHLHPDREAWASAPDRYSNKYWYREFGGTKEAFLKNRKEIEYPLQLAIKAFQDYFRSFPTTLICPGDEFTNEVLEKALQAGIRIVSSYYTGIRIGNQLCWTQHICAPYLDLADSKWFKAGLPVVGYFHDIDIKTNGIAWFSNWLDQWQLAGAKLFTDFRVLSSLLNAYFHLEKINTNYKLTVTSEDECAFTCPIRVGFYFPDGKTPSDVIVRFKDEELKLNLKPDQENLISLRHNTVFT